MPLHVVDHPLVSHRVAVLRDAATGSAEFRQVAGELAGFLAYEATRGLTTVDGSVLTPLGLAAPTATLPERRPLLVPILRAGLALLDGVLAAVPTAEVGLVGLARDEVTHQPTPYCVRLPAERSSDEALVLDPMLATGGSMAYTCGLLAEAGYSRLTAIVLIAAPEGVAAVEAAMPDVSIVTAALDPGLNEHAFIVPGLGDAGDRLYGRA
jgi:uracil phosphoribosyltransferase